jgi:lysophospholipase L1-like esterase
MAKKRRPFARLLLLGTSLLLAAGLGELAFRWLAPTPFEPVRYFAVDGPRVPDGEIGHFMTSWVVAMTQQERREPRGWLPPGTRFRMGYDRARWPYFDADGCVTYRVGAHGFRDLDFPVAKRRGELRILALGDSFTFGFGVRLEDSWPQQLEGLLRKERADPVEVVNAGFACLSFTCGMFHAWVEQEGIRLAPDLVIVGFCLNDMGNVPLLSYPIVRAEPVLGGFSKILDAVVRERRQRQVLAEPRDMSEAVRADPAPWNLAQNGLRLTKAILDRQQVPLLVVVFPMLSELGDRYPYAKLHAMVREFCATAQIRCLDLLPAFAHRDERSLWAHETDQHPNDEGMRIIATSIHDYLLVEKLVPAAGSR